MGRREELPPLGFCESRKGHITDASSAPGYTGGKQVTMAYQFEFFRRTRDIPAGKTVRREMGEFDDLRSARAYCIAELQEAAPADEMDGCRIYRDGVYEATVSGQSVA
jgi:hypothetical protein